MQSEVLFGRLLKFYQSSWAGLASLIELMAFIAIRIGAAHFNHLPPAWTGILGVISLLLILSFVGHCAVVVSRRVWDPWFSIAFILLAYFLAQVIASFLVSIYPLMHGWQTAQVTNWLNNSIVAQFFYVLLAEALTLAAVWGYLKLFRISFGKIGLLKPKAVDGFWTLAGAGAYYLIYAVAIGLITHLFHGFNANQQQEIGFTDVHTSAQYVLTFISLVILPPLTEEILVRGLLYSSLKKGMPQLAAVIVTSALFAGAHLPEGGAAGLLWVGALDTFILSLVLIFLREKTGRLWAGMGLHALKNGIAFLALFVLVTR